MEWLFPYYWAAVLGAPADPMTWWETVGRSRRESDTDDALDLEVVRVIYEVLAHQGRCLICAAPLHRAVDTHLTRAPFTGARILVVTHCLGPRPHRHVASVAERAGHLRFGPLRPC